MSSGYFNFDVELGNYGEAYAVNCFSNMIVVKGYVNEGNYVNLPDDIDDNKFYCIKRRNQLSVCVAGWHLNNTIKTVGRRNIPFEAIIQVNKYMNAITNLTTINKANLKKVLPSSDEHKKTLKEHHSSFEDKSKYDFSLEFLTEYSSLVDYKVEVKTDAQTPITGNIFMEFEQNTSSSWKDDWDKNKKVSGMKITEAGIWAYLLSPEMFVFMGNSILNEIYEKRNTYPYKVKLGGNKTPNEKNPRTKGVVVPVSELFKLDYSINSSNNFTNKSKEENLKYSLL